MGLENGAKPLCLLDSKPRPRLHLHILSQVFSPLATPYPTMLNKMVFDTILFIKICCETFRRLDRPSSMNHRSEILPFDLNSPQAKKDTCKEILIKNIPATFPQLSLQGDHLAKYSYKTQLSLLGHKQCSISVAVVVATEELKVEINGPFYAAS